MTDSGPKSTDAARSVVLSNIRLPCVGPLRPTVGSLYEYSQGMHCFGYVFPNHILQNLSQRTRGMHMIIEHALVWSGWHSSCMIASSRVFVVRCRVAWPYVTLLSSQQQLCTNVHMCKLWQICAHNSHPRGTEYLCTFVTATHIHT